MTQKCTDAKPCEVCELATELADERMRCQAAEARVAELELVEAALADVLTEKKQVEVERDALADGIRAAFKNLGETLRG